MEMQEDKNAILERKKAVFDMLTSDTTGPEITLPERQLSRRERRIKQAAFTREQKKLAKSLINVPDWLK